MAYRSSVYDTNGMAPAKFLFGSEIRLPGDLMFRSPETQSQEPQNLSLIHIQMCIRDSAKRSRRHRRRGRRTRNRDSTVGATESMWETWTSTKGLSGQSSEAGKRAVGGTAGCVLTSWRNKVPRQYTMSTLQKNSGSLVVTGFIQEKPASITVDTDATVFPMWALMW